MADNEKTGSNDPDDDRADDANASEVETDASDAVQDDGAADESEDAEADAPDDTPDVDAAEADRAGPTHVDAKDETPLPDAPEPSAPKPLPKGWRLAVQLILPVALCAGAVGVHWWINVPDEITVSPRDQGAKKKGKKNRRKRKRKPKQAKAEPRDEQALKRAWTRWNERELEDEPVDVAWARRHQSLLRKAFFEARKDAFEGAPEEPAVTFANAKCHTVRCRFLLRSPFAHENDAVNDALSRLQSEDASVWRHYESERIEAPEGEPPDDDYVSVTVAFSVDDVEAKTLAVAAVEPSAGSAGEPSRGSAGERGAGASAGAPVEG